MAKYLYLSDPLSVTFTLPTTLKGTNVPYTVTNIHGKTIYTGSVYATGEKQTIYLNDIVNSQMDDFDWFITKTDTSSDLISADITTIISVKFNGVNEYYTTSNILLAHRVPNSKIEETIDFDANHLYSLTDFGTGVIPRIPAIIEADSDFFLETSFMYSSDIIGDSNIIKFDVYNSNDTAVQNVWNTNLYYDSAFKSRYSTKYKLNAGALTNASIYFKTATDTKGCYIGIKGNNFPEGAHTKICNIDDCPADYYVSWINHYGTWQCQPLHSKWEMKEKVTTNNLVTMNNETVPYSKTSEFSWTLNTDWLTYAEHEEFESLLTSKYVMLYNSKTKECNYVNVANSEWTFKNAVNTKRPFNLTLNLTKSRTQIITY